MTTSIQAILPSPHALTECQQVVPSQSTFSLPSAADLTIAASTSFHFSFEKSNFTDEESQSTDSVAGPVALSSSCKPDFGSLEGVSESLSYTCNQMDPSRVSPYRRQVAGHHHNSRIDPVCKLLWDTMELLMINVLQVKGSFSNTNFSYKLR